MAILHNSIFGTVKGKIGDLIFKQQNGKTVICQKPAKRKTTVDISVLNRRKRFALVTKLSQQINKSQDLKNLWYKIAGRKMSVANAITKANFDRVSYNRIVDIPFLTPDSHAYDPSSLIVNYNDSVISVEYNGKEFPFIQDFNEETHIRLHSVIYAENPKYNDLPDENFVVISSDLVPVNKDAAVEFKLTLNFFQEQILNSYSKHTIFSAVMSYKSLNIPVNHISTFCENLIL